MDQSGRIISTFMGEGWWGQGNQYDTWDQLMPVIEKIMDIAFSDEEHFDSEDFYDIRDCIPDLNATRTSVVGFIILYNKVKK